MNLLINTVLSLDGTIVSSLDRSDPNNDNIEDHIRVLDSDSKVNGLYLMTSHVASSPPHIQQIEAIRRENIKKRSSSTSSTSTFNSPTSAIAQIATPITIASPAAASGIPVTPIPFPSTPSPNKKTKHT